MQLAPTRRPAGTSARRADRLLGLRVWQRMTLKNVATALADRFDGHYCPDSAGGHIKFFSRKTLSRLFETTGVDVLEFAGCGRLPFLWKSMVLVGRRRPEDLQQA